MVYFHIIMRESYIEYVGLYCSHFPLKYGFIIVQIVIAESDIEHTANFTCIQTLHVVCMRPHMYINQNSRLQTTRESKATPSRTILWGYMPKTCSTHYPTQNTDVQTQVISTVAN